MQCICDQQRGGDCMSEAVVDVGGMMRSLNAENYKLAVRFIRSLVERQNKEIQQKADVLSEIQSLMQEERPWQTEEEMLADMAQFRRERMQR